ncbi:MULTISPECIES: UDP-glucuronic acid decarboxylase family protein [unclassified Brevundimonas]|uniref:UDP-glucuronic acid decarboxylase family protein n=1 Tax=unclassified Brevundimonas TaxID=2622653 RepID=UPI000CFBCF07|nr:MULTISPECIES: UDP-glucuronic acid decarboxylase family protein [unclassified Brevundimonas]PRA32620.1 dTDP-glucose 4,6-dehydratase [Brevundimonas sp. MYb27]PQZ77583.1 dTDP-glucose 4,6-dehydratase [Brevundimonas sp. MYb31]PRB16830.1 dTDP-glucose 4,6-dehydratase [Brevundimonas sp. MYb52]PRB37456.1 dTDP-glucose 4,6-dehydratase [Brevundimonas sp. MYb46]PRB47636.1 dTDP-glucose 4,6-dehydratase [Brevundimonas sp. MYb33]
MVENRHFYNRHDDFGETPNATIIVAGGAGFLGSHLCTRLIENGHYVICVDNFHTGRPQNVAHLESSGRFSLLNHDINTPLPSDLPKVDQIYNLACPASPVHYQYDRVKTALTCSLGTLNLLNRAAVDRARFFQASTSEIYGDPEVHPQTENYRGNVNTVGPRSCYDEGKRFAETLVTDFGAQHGLTTRIVRIFNTYGPRMHPDDGRVVSNFIVQALMGEDITIYGSGEQTRSFCFVDDLVEGFIRLMNAGEDIDGPINIGNPNETTVKQLAEQILAMAKSRSKIVYHPLPVDDPRRRKPDISRALARLNWSPQVPLHDGLSRTIAYFTEEMKNSGRSSTSALAS